MGASAALQELRSRIDLERWERIFERCLRDCEGKEGRKAVSAGNGGSLHRQAQLAAASGTSSTSRLYHRLKQRADEQHHQVRLQ